MKGLLVGNVCAPLLSSLRFVAGRADASKEVHGWEGRIGGRLGVAVLRGRAGTDVQVTRVVCTESCDMSVVHVACSDRIWGPDGRDGPHASHGVSSICRKLLIRSIAA